MMSNASNASNASEQEETSESSLFDRTGANEQEEMEESEDDQESKEESEESEEESEEESDESDESDESEEEDGKGKTLALPALPANVSNAVNVVRVELGKELSDEKRVEGADQDRMISESCTSKYRFGNYITRGTKAVIYDVCWPYGNCAVVIRVVDIESEESRREYVTDVRIRRIVARCNRDLAVAFLDAFICKESEVGIGITKKVLGNLLQLVDRVESVMGSLEQRCKNLLLSLHKCNVTHRDINLYNFLYDEDNDSIRVMLTDFEGAASQVDPLLDPERYDREKNAFEFYKDGDLKAVDKFMRELRLFQEFKAAVNAGNVEVVKSLWDNRMGTFLKKNISLHLPVLYGQKEALLKQKFGE